MEFVFGRNEIELRALEYYASKLEKISNRDDLSIQLIGIIKENLKLEIDNAKAIATAMQSNTLEFTMITLGQFCVALLTLILALLRMD